MSRHYLALTPTEHARLMAAAKKYGCSAHELALKAVMQEVLRVEMIPTHPPKATQAILDGRTLEQEVLAALEELGGSMTGGESTDPEYNRFLERQAAKTKDKE